MKIWHNVIPVGATRTGKTTTGLRELQQQPGLKFFINTKNERKWDKYCYAGNPSLDDIDIIYNNPEIHSQGIISISPRNIANAYSELEKYIKKIFTYHMEDNLLNTVLCVDEIHEYQSKRGVGDSLRRCFSMGLGIGLKTIGISQRPTQIHNDILTNSEIFIAHAVSWDDLEHLSKFMKFEEYCFDVLKLEKFNPRIMNHLYPVTEIDKLSEIPVSHKAYLQNGRANKLVPYVP